MSASSPKEYGSSINPVNLPKGTGNPHTIEHPTQGQPWGSNNYEVPNTNQRGKTPLGGGDLSRNYNFGNTYTNLSFQRDPFVHLLTKFKKKPTDDFKFEYAIKRNMATFKRYGYVLGIRAGSTASADLVATSGGASWGSTSLNALMGSGAAFEDFATTSFSTVAVGDAFSLMMGGDYKIHGNIGNKIGSGAAGTGSANNMKVGQYLTKPSWFLPNQIVRIPTNSSLTSIAPEDYALARITAVHEWSVVNSTPNPDETVAHGVILNCVLVKKPSSALIPTSLGSSNVLPDVNITGASHAESVAGKLEPIRTYISGTAYHELSGYGDTWKQQPFTTDFGQTQIFKKTAMMSGRAMATGLKFGENPWANEWGDKMAEMTWEIGQAGYFGEQTVENDITYTEGIVNFILNNGNSFTWSPSHTVDDYMEQLSTLHDPRFMVGGKQSHVYYCNTQVYNWHAKLGGFMKNNAEISANYNIQYSGTGKMAGVNYRSFDVDGSTIKLVRDIHLDGTNVKMICANMSACAIRPLIGNGVNRDVTVYPGVKTVKNSGEDYRVDLIQADLGFEFGAPETHAVWL